MSIGAIATEGLTFDPAPHIYRLHGVTLPSVTTVLKDNRLSGDFSRVDPTTLEAARARGQAVHAALHYLDEGDLDETTLDPVVRPFVGAWQAFLVERRVAIVSSELLVAHVDHRFAGTIDRLAIIPGFPGVTILDLKTGDFTGGAYQTAGYELLAREARPDCAIFSRAVVHLHPDRGLGYTLHPYRETSDRRVFLAALLLTHTRARTGRARQEAA